MLTKQNTYLPVTLTYSEFCELLDGTAQPKQTKEELREEMNDKVDKMLAKYRRREIEALKAETDELQHEAMLDGITKNPLDITNT